MRLVFDACSLIAVLRLEPNHETVLRLLANKENDCFIHSANLCEVFYETARESGESRAEEVVDYVLNMGLRLREDMDRPFVMDAGRIKAIYRRISLADCCCAALSNRIGAEIVTCDHEFDPIANGGLCKVRFIR